MFHDFPLITNFISQMQPAQPVPRLLDRRAEKAELINQALIRYGGWLKEEREQGQRRIANPIRWLVDGVRTILMIPFLVLVEFNVLGRSLVHRIEGSWGLRAISGLFALAAAASSAVTVLLGWDQTVALAKSLLAG